MNLREYQITEEDIERGYVEDDGEDGICHGCRDHSSPAYEVIVSADGQADLGECVSSCCGAKIWVP